MVNSLIPAPTTRSLARELGTIRQQLDKINAGGRATQLDRSSLMYPLILRDPKTGEILGSFGPSNGSASLIPVGGAPPPAPSAPTLTPLMEGVLVAWDGTFIDPEYVPPLLLARGITPRGLGALTVTVPGYPAGKVAAAEAILSRLQGGQPIFEDWTWHGCPAVVGTWNDTLLADAAADGLSGDNWPFSAAARDWLRAYLVDADAAKELAENPPEGEPGGETGGDTEGDGGILSPDTPEKIAAAGVILDRFRSGKPINPETWTFPGCPPYVTVHGPVLHDEWNNRGEPANYLQQWMETHATTPHNFGYAGIHYGPTEDFVTDPSNLAGTLTGAGTFPISPVSEKIYVRLVGYNNSTPPVSGPASDTVSMTPNRVVATEILAGIVTEVALSDQAVSTRTVQLASIQAQLVAAAAITGPAIAPSAVGTDKIAAQAVTADQMAANSVRAGSVEAAAITAAALAAGSVGANAILANSIGAQQIAAAAIDATHLRSQSVTAAALAALAVTADKVAANAINAGHLVAGAVTADKLAALLVMATRMIAGDPNGSRAEINGSGIFGFAGSLNTFSLRSDGTAFLNGQIESGSGNDRIVIQPGGSGRPDIQFFALPTNPAYINAVPVQINGTSTDGVGIGVNSGPRPTPFTGRQTTLLVRPDRATLGYTAIGSAAARGGLLYVDANFCDMTVYSDTGSMTSRIRLGANGAVADDPITAPGFPVSSDVQTKTGHRTMIEWDPFRAMKGQVGVWRYRTQEPHQEHLGPVDARAFPRWMHRTHPDPDNDTITINLGDMVGVALLMADLLDDRVSRLEQRARVA